MCAVWQNIRTIHEMCINMRRGGFCRENDKQKPQPFGANISSLASSRDSPFREDIAARMITVRREVW